MKPKLLIATDFFEPRLDGVSVFLSEVIPRLKEQFDIRIVAPDFKGKKKFTEHISRIDLSKIKIGDVKIIKLNFKTLKTIRKEVRQTDIVWVQALSPIGYLASQIAYSYNKLLIGFEHAIQWELISKALKRKMFSGIVRSISKYVIHRIYNKFDMIMVPSYETKELLNINGIGSVKKLVYLGIDCDRFKPAINKGEAKKNIGINPGIKVIGYCGRIAREKDIRTLLRAYLRVHSRINNTVLLLVGEGISDYDRILKSHPDIIAVGKKEDVVPYLQAMDIYVLPSLTETSSLSTMEAMACEVAPICTKVGLVANYIKEKQNGIFFKQQNPLALSIKINQLLTDSELRKTLGINARKTIVKRYTWEGTVKRCSELIFRVLKKYHTPNFNKK